MLSFCMIVKNEERFLPQCLESVRHWVDELVVVDTGSTDATVEIARSYGAKVAFFEWCDDFAAARNFSLEQVYGDWILTLDADETLVVEDPNCWAQLMADPAVLVYLLPRYDESQPITSLQTPRLFQNLPDLRFVGRYHEQLRYQNQPLSGQISQSLTHPRIIHYGYSPEGLLDKNLNREIPMLERIRQREPLSLLLLMTLADAYLRTDQEEKAREIWAEAFDRILPNLLSGDRPETSDRIPALLFTLGSDLLLGQQNIETAILVCRRGLEWFPNHPPLNHLTGLLLREMGFLLGAVPYFEECLRMGRDGDYYRHEPIDRCFMTSWAACDLGVTHLIMNRIPQAIAAFELALSFDPSYEPAQVGLAEAAHRQNQNVPKA